MMNFITLVPLLGFLLCLFSELSWAIPLNEVHFKPGQRVGFYEGSFDPLHLGHMEIVKNSLSEGLCDYVLVIPDHKYFDKKPNRLSYQLRQEMIEGVYSDSPHVIVTRLNYLDALRFLKKQGVKIIGIIGSDKLLLAEELPYIPDEWHVHARKGEEYQLDDLVIAEWNQRPVKKFTFLDEGISSTKIKQILIEGSDGESSFLDPRVSQFIQDRYLYQAQNPKEKITARLMELFWTNRNPDAAMAFVQLFPSGSSERVFLDRLIRRYEIILREMSQEDQVTIAFPPNATTSHGSSRSDLAPLEEDDSEEKVLPSRYPSVDTSFKSTSF